MPLRPNDRVVISTKQLHGNFSVLSEGQLISIEGSSCKVHVDDETSPRIVPLASISSTSDTFGEGYNGGQNETSVINALRHQ